MAEHYSQAGKLAENAEQHQRHLEQMVAYYQRTAGDYSKWHCNHAGSSHDYAVRKVIEFMSGRELTSVLDVCCGTGRCIATARAAGFDATGIDISKELLEAGMKEFDLPADRMIQGDATALPFPDNSFDVACILGALHHTAMPHTIIDEMIRVSRQVVVVSDEANHLHGAIRSMLMRTGLFSPVYRLIFRREPKLKRRSMDSEGDGPTFDFTIEEIIPALKARLPVFQSMSFIRIGKSQFRVPWWPRMFATQAVVVAATVSGETEGGVG